MMKVSPSYKGKSVPISFIINNLYILLIVQKCSYTLASTLDKCDFICYTLLKNFKKHFKKIGMCPMKKEHKSLPPSSLKSFLKVVSWVTIICFGFSNLTLISPSSAFALRPEAPRQQGIVGELEYAVHANNLVTAHGKGKKQFNEVINDVFGLLSANKDVSLEASIAAVKAQILGLKDTKLTPAQLLDVANSFEIAATEQKKHGSGFWKKALMPAIVVATIATSPVLGQAHEVTAGQPIQPPSVAGKLVPGIESELTLGEKQPTQEENIIEIDPSLFKNKGPGRELYLDLANGLKGLPNASGRKPGVDLRDYYLKFTIESQSSVGIFFDFSSADEVAYSYPRLIDKGTTTVKYDPANGNNPYAKRSDFFSSIPGIGIRIGSNIPGIGIRISSDSTASNIKIVKAELIKRPTGANSTQNAIKLDPGAFSNITSANSLSLSLRNGLDGLPNASSKEGTVDLRNYYLQFTLDSKSGADVVFYFKSAERWGRSNIRYLDKGRVTVTYDPYDEIEQYSGGTNYFSTIEEMGIEVMHGNIKSAGLKIIEATLIPRDSRQQPVPKFDVSPQTPPGVGGAVVPSNAQPLGPGTIPTPLSFKEILEHLGSSEYQDSLRSVLADAKDKPIELILGSSVLNNQVSRDNVTALVQAMQKEYGFTNLTLSFDKPQLTGQANVKRVYITSDVNNYSPEDVKKDRVLAVNPLTSPRQIGVLYQAIFTALALRNLTLDDVQDPLNGKARAVVKLYNDLNPSPEELDFNGLVTLLNPPDLTTLKDLLRKIVASLPVPEAIAAEQITTLYEAVEEAVRNI